MNPQPDITDWYGYEKSEYQFEGRLAIVVAPRQKAATSPYIWRTEFFAHEPQLDVALLEQGWHVVHYVVSDLYGVPVAIEAMRQFQSHLESQYGLQDKAVLEGMSRGGLYAFNYAAAYPEKVAAMYLDNPVLDIRSWPAGQGVGPGAPKEWQECIEAYGLTPETVCTFAGPLDRIEPVAAAKIPIIAVCGDADEVVPYEENGAILYQKYRELGAPMQMILRPGFKHHPHSLTDPAPLVDFLREALPADFEREKSR